MSKGLLSPNADAPIDMVCPVNWLHPLNRDLVVWWLTLSTLDGGPFFYDLLSLGSTTGKHGVLTGPPAWTSTGRPASLGRDIFINANSSYVTTPTVFPAVPTDATIAAWLRISASVTFFPLCLTNGGTSNGIEFLCNTGIQLRINTNTIGATVAVSDGIWRHFVGTRHKGVASFYINGVLSQTASSSAAMGSVGPFQINKRGSSAAGATSVFSINDVRLWGRGVSDQEAADIYKLSRLGNPGLLRRLNISVPRQYAATSGGLLMRRRRAVA